MAVLPTFSPAEAPGTSARVGLQSQNDAQNWMTQASQRQRIQADTQGQQLQNARMQAELPARVAEAQANVIAAQTGIVAATDMQRLRGQWQDLKPKVIQDIADIEDPNNQPATEDGTPDWEDKYHQYEQLQAKYGALNLFPEGKEYYSMIDKAKQNAFAMASQHATAQAHLNQVNAAAEGRLAGITEATQGRLQTAEISAGAKRDVATTSAGARVGAANVSAGAKLTQAALHEFSRAADDYETAALKEEDPEKSAALMQKANAFRAKAQKYTPEDATPSPAGGTAKVSINIPGAEAGATDDNGPEEPGGEPAGSPEPETPATPVKPVQVDWAQAKSLKPGTPYVGPDGKHYVRGRQ